MHARMTTPDETAPVSRLRRVTNSFWFQLVLAFCVVGLVLTFIAKPYVVPSGSMEETLVPGDRVLVNRLAYSFSEPQPGDIVVFDADEAWEGERASSDNPVTAFLRWVGEVSGFGPSGAHTLIKRVIATPGQSVECCTIDGAVLVDGEPLDEPYVFDDYAFEPGVLDCTTTPQSQRCFAEVVVPEKSYLVLGDHRSRSADSAASCRAQPTAPASCWRWASRDAIVGKAVVILWPFSRWSGL